MARNINQITILNTGSVQRDLTTDGVFLFKNNILSLVYWKSWDGHRTIKITHMVGITIIILIFTDEGTEEQSV